MSCWGVRPRQACCGPRGGGGVRVVVAFLTTVMMVGAWTSAWADWRAELATIAGPSGVVHAMDEEGESLVSVGGDEAFRPASMLKIVTALLAERYLGLDTRFRTEFFVHGDRLIVRGRGDPFLVSEELDRIAQALLPLLKGRSLSGVFIDDSFFEPNITVPGVGSSEQPYDALNSATAVNFNTVHVTVVGDQVRSAEAQTPLTPLAREVALSRGVRGTERVSLSDDPEVVRRYASQLIAAKLRAHGIQVGTAFGSVKVASDLPLYVHESSKTVADVCSAMLVYSNNYVANQVFLAVGEVVHGAPASLEKSRSVARDFVAENVGLKGMVMVEGSGISYENRATSQALLEALRLFQPQRNLMRERRGVRHKTGTLKITKSVAGYLDTQSHGTVRFVVALDGRGSEARWDIVRLLGEKL
ncbi:MAG TPA: D-alanyl-D-alanine carboxypeptidase [Deltaproteobacteria bacterium]|nr:D-alanyl-D-alanine carboxypeptidase [Deltaproteobacteria bacterium]